jgi:hypothetical protein
VQSRQSGRAFSEDEYQADSGMAADGLSGQGFVTGHKTTKRPLRPVKCQNNLDIHLSEIV